MTTHCGYGAFPGGDPRNFTPDPECSTDEEREAHRRACIIWAAHGALPPMDPDHLLLTDPEGRLLIHIARCRFGLGTYQFDDGEPDDQGDNEPAPIPAWYDEVQP